MIIRGTPIDGNPQITAKLKLATSNVENIQLKMKLFIQWFG
jgi:hypothetical protein